MSDNHSTTKSGGLFELVFNNAVVRTILGLGMMFGGMVISGKGTETWEAIEKQYGVPVDLGKTLATIGVFLIIFPIMRVFYTDPLKNAINERNSELEHTFTEAENLREQMQTMRNDYERRLVQTEAEARTQIEAQIKEAQQLRQTLMAEAAQRADELVERAQQEIEAEKNKVMTQIRTHVVDLSLAAAEKVISENMDTERNRKLVDEFLTQIEVAR